MTREFVVAVISDDTKEDVVEMLEAAAVAINTLRAEVERLRAMEARARKWARGGTDDVREDIADWILNG